LSLHYWREAFCFVYSQPKCLETPAEYVTKGVKQKKGKTELVKSSKQ